MSQRAATATPVRKGRDGYQTVNYRDVKGRTVAAEILGPGSVSGVKLIIRTAGDQQIDNVPLRTGLKQTGVYWYNP